MITNDKAHVHDNMSLQEWYPDTTEMKELKADTYVNKLPNKQRLLYRITRNSGNNIFSLKQITVLLEIYVKYNLYNK